MDCIALCIMTGRLGKRNLCGGPAGTVHFAQADSSEEAMTPRRLGLRGAWRGDRGLAVEARDGSPTRRCDRRNELLSVDSLLETERNRTLGPPADPGERVAAVVRADLAEMRAGVEREIGLERPDLVS